MRVKPALGVLLSLFMATPVTPQNVASIGGAQSGAGRGWQVARLDLSIAQVINLNSTPITAIPARAGYVIWVSHVTAIRTGTPYLTSNNMTVRCVTSAPFAWVTISSVLLTDAGSGGRMAQVTALTGTSGAASDAATHVGNKAVDAFVLTANPTVDGTNTGSPIILYIYFLYLPSYSTSAPQ